MLTATVSADRPVPGAGGSVKVVNYCRDPVRLNSVGDSAGETFIIPHREHWREQYKMKDAGGGPSIKISQEGTSILQLEYTIAGPRIFYDLSCTKTPNQHQPQVHQQLTANKMSTAGTKRPSPGSPAPSGTSRSCWSRLRTTSPAPPARSARTPTAARAMTTPAWPSSTGRPSRRSRMITRA